MSDARLPTAPVATVATDQKMPNKVRPRRPPMRSDSQAPGMLKHE